MTADAPARLAAALGLAALAAAARWLVLARVLRAAGRGHGRPRASSPDGRFDPGGVLEVLGRPRVHRVLWFTRLVGRGWRPSVTVLLGLPAAFVLHRLRFPGRGLLRAFVLVPFVLPTVVVGVAFRTLLGAVRAAGLPAASTAPRRRSSPALVFFNLAVVVRTVGAPGRRSTRAARRPRPRSAPRPGRCCAPSRCPRCGPAIVSAASVVFLFCATAFGVVLTLGGLRYATSRPRSTCSPPSSSTCRPRPRCRCCSCVVVAGLLYVAGRRAPCAGPASTGRRSRDAAAPGRAATCRRCVVDRARCSCSWRPRSLTLVVGSLRVDGALEPGATTARCTTTGDAPALLVPVTDGARQLAADRRRRHLDVAAARRCSVALVVTRRSRSRAERRLRAALDGVFMLPLGVSAVTLGFGFLITLDRPPLDLRELAAAGADRAGAGRAAARRPHPRAGAAPASTTGSGRPPPRWAPSPLRALLTVDLPVRVAAAAGRHRLRLRGLARRVRRDQLPGPRRPPDAAGRDLPADRPPRARRTSAWRWPPPWCSAATTAVVMLVGRAAPASRSVGAF